MSLLSPAGVMGTTGSRYRSPRVRLPPMTLLCPAGSAIHPAISIIENNHLQIQQGSSAIGTASRFGLMLEMAIFAAPLEIIITEDSSDI
jgi:hypothetical protein